MPTDPSFHPSIGPSTFIVSTHTLWGQSACSTLDSTVETYVNKKKEMKNNHLASMPHRVSHSDY